MQHKENKGTDKEKVKNAQDRKTGQTERVDLTADIEDHSPVNTNYHAAFLGGLRILLWPYRE